MYYIDHFTALVQAIRLLYEKGLAVSGRGSVSERMSEDCVLLTPLGMHPLRIQPENLLESSLRTAPACAEHRAHRALYRAYAPQAAAIAPLPYALALARAAGGDFAGILPEFLRAGFRVFDPGAGSSPAAKPAEKGKDPQRLLYLPGIGFAALAATGLDCAGILEAAESACKAECLLRLLQVPGGFCPGEGARI